MTFWGVLFPLVSFSLIIFPLGSAISYSQMDLRCVEFLRWASLLWKTPTHPFLQLTSWSWNTGGPHHASGAKLRLLSLSATHTRWHKHTHALSLSLSHYHVATHARTHAHTHTRTRLYQDSYSIPPHVLSSFTLVSKPRRPTEVGRWASTPPTPTPTPTRDTFGPDWHNQHWNRKSRSTQLPKNLSNSFVSSSIENIFPY